jgi:hypothetical protein
MKYLGIERTAFLQGDSLYSYLISLEKKKKNASGMGCIA